MDTLDLVTWSDEYSVNIREIDSQHKKLVKLITLLQKETDEKNQHKAVNEILEELIKYTVYHFSFEESLFAQYSYPETRTHIQAHTELIEQLKTFLNEFHSSGNVLPIDLINFLQKWLIDHIVGEDKKYSGYLNSKGVN